MAKTTTTRASSSAKTSPAKAPAGAEAVPATSIALAQAQDVGTVPPDTVSTNNSGDDVIGGAGDPASPAEVYSVMTAALDELPPEEFRWRWPRLTAALEDLSNAGASTAPLLKVSAKVAGFRRGGMAHGVEPATYPLESLHPDAVEAILGEPMLVAELVEGE